MVSGRFGDTSSSVFVLAANPDVGEGGKIFRDRVVKPKLAFVDQLHRHEARDRLAHRKQAEDGIIGHRQLGRDIAYAEEFAIDRLAVLLDQQDRAGDFSLRDLVAQIVADTLKLLRIEMRARGNIEGTFRASRRRGRDRQHRR
jgi:hypothetical protein